MGAHPDVSESAVVVDRSVTDPRLVAFFVARAGRSVSATDLRVHALAHLPAFMVPAAFQALERMPRGPHEKVDRSALTAMAASTETLHSHVPPESRTEEALVELWKELLNVRGVGIDDDFFALGGHSLLVVRMLSRIEEQALGTRLGVRDVLSGPTIRKLAPYSSRLRSGERSSRSARSKRRNAPSSPTCSSRPRPLPRPRPARSCSRGQPGSSAPSCSGRSFVERAATSSVSSARDPRTPESGGSSKRSTATAWTCVPISNGFSLGSATSELPPARALRSGHRRAEDGSRRDLPRRRPGPPRSALRSFASRERRGDTRGPAAPGDGAAEASAPRVVALHIRPQRRAARHLGGGPSIDDERHYRSRGYAASKWCADKLVLAAVARGAPCSVYRLGRVAGDSERGTANLDDMFCRLLLSCAALGFWPDDGLLRDNILPVDTMARAIVALALDGTEPAAVHHIHAESDVDLRAFMQVYTARWGARAEPTSLADWVLRLRRAGETGRELPMAPYLPLLEERAASVSRSVRPFDAYDNELTRNRLWRSGVTLPPSDLSLIAKYWRYLGGVGAVEAGGQKVRGGQDPNAGEMPHAE